MRPAAITLVETVTMTARPVSVPFAVSTVRLRRVSIDFTGVDNCTVTPSASAASNAPNPWRQKVAVVRSAAREKSSAENCAKSLPQPNGPSMNSTVGAPVAEIVRHHLLARHVGLARARR